MSIHELSFRTAVLLALVLAGAAVGCNSNRRDIVVSLDDSLRDPRYAQNVQVDVVGMNRMDYNRLKHKSMREYWTEATQHAHSNDWSRQVLTFANGPVQRVSKSDPIWETWKKDQAQYIFVLSNIPGSASDLPGSADPRRKIFPIQSKFWPGGAKEIRVRVTPGGLRTDTPPKDTWTEP